MSRALWETIVYPPFFISGLLSLPLSQLPLLYFAHKLPFLLGTVHSPALSLVIPAFLLSFATFLSQVFIPSFPALCLFSAVPFWTMEESPGLAAGPGAAGASLWLTALCGAAAWPLSFCQGKLREPREEVEQWERRGGEDQLGCHSCVEVLGTLGFKQCTVGGGGEASAKQPSNFSPRCSISIGLEMTELAVMLVHVLVVSNNSAREILDLVRWGGLILQCTAT